MLYYFRRIYKNVVEVSWPVVLLLVVLPHYIISYSLLSYAQEEMLSINTYSYYWMTTITTVGYGDISPKTDLGKLFSTLFILPGGVLIFGVLLGKALEEFKKRIGKRMNGLSDYSNLFDHIVILGWNDKKTLRMIDLIFGDKNRIPREVLLCISKDIKNPDPDRIKFVKGESLTDENLLKRAGIPRASKIIILGKDDDQTLTISLSAARLITNFNCNVVAYFEKQSSADILSSCCEQAECVVSSSVEMLVRTAQDPGCSYIQQQLLSTLKGPTYFSTRIKKKYNYSLLSDILKSEYNATLIGVYDFNNKNIILNTPSNYITNPNDTLFYLSDERIINI